MLDNKMALGGAGTPARARGEGGFRNNNITCDTKSQFLVSDFLRHGSANATTCRELASMLHWRPRDITRAVEAERRQGKLIAANSKGYFLPADDCELERYLNSLQHRENEVKKTRQAVALTRQMRMDYNMGAGD